MSSNSAVNDYKKVERGEMSEQDFRNQHGVSTKRYEDDFMDQYGIDLVNPEITQVTDEGKKYMRGLVKRNYNQGGMVVDDITVDPVSGNPVPTGSAPSEVRDDVQANLSEGEFVVPANVVQYYGVKYFDGLINKAEEKLQDVPRGEPAEDPELEMNYNEGGLVDGMSPLTPPAQDMMEQSEGYGFKTFYGPNGEAKEIMFLNGEPQSPIPAGYSATRPQARPQSRDDRRERGNTSPTPEDIQRDMYHSLDELDFNDQEGVVNWANEKMTKPEGIAAGLLGATLPGGLINVAREARGIAEVNAAARVARAQGNDSLAQELEERVAANNSIAKRMLPQEWIDGDQIARNYTSRESAATDDVRPQARPSSRDKDRVPNNGKGSQEMQQALGNILQGADESRTRPQARPTNMNKGGLVEKKKYDNDDDYVRSIT